MRLSKAILMMAIAVALSAYATDCPPATTPMQAMQCCQTMNCTPSGHGQDCCETMPSLHAPFVKASKVEVSASSVAVLAMVSVRAASEPMAPSPDFGFTNSHAPPTRSAVQSLSPLRI